MAASIAVITALDLGATASAIVAWARLSRASGIPISCTACAAATAVVQRGRVGQADVLAGQDHQPAGDEARVLPGLDHPRQVVQRRVGVGAAHRLDERADHVVVLVALPVVADRGPVDGRLGGRRGRSASSPCGRGAGGRLEVGQRAAGVTTGEPHQVVAGRRRRGSTAPARPRSSASARSRTARDVVVGERLQASAAGCARAAGEITEKNGFSVVAATRVTQRFSTPGQQRVLLGLAEAVHLVDEQHGLLAAAGQLGAGRRRSPPAPP